MTGAGKTRKKAAQAELDQRWDGFAHLPGTRLSWHKRRWGNWELVAANGEVWATVKEGWGSTQISARGKTYERRDVSRPYEPPMEWEWVDDAGLPVLRFKGTHFERRAGTALTLRDESAWKFPVTGRWNQGLMTAVDQWQNGYIHYRLNPPTRVLAIDAKSRRRVESVISPAAHEIPHIALIAASTPGLLLGYFSSPTSGG